MLGVARLAVDTTLVSEKTRRQIRKSSTPRGTQTQRTHIPQTVQTSASWSPPWRQGAVSSPFMKTRHPSSIAKLLAQAPPPPASRLPSRPSGAEAWTRPNHACTSGAVGMKIEFVGCCPVEQYCARVTARGEGTEKKSKQVGVSKPDIWSQRQLATIMALHY